MKRTLVTIAAALAVGSFATPSKACEPRPETVSYEVVTNETAAGDLDTRYQDNIDWELDATRYCTVTQMPNSVQMYDEVVYVAKCNVPINEMPRTPTYS